MCCGRPVVIQNHCYAPTDRRVLPLFWRGLLRRAKLAESKLHARCRESSMNQLTLESGRAGVRFNYLVWPDEAAIELLIDTGDQAENKRIFDVLYLQRKFIEAGFGGMPRWERLDEQRPSRVRILIPHGLKQGTTTAWSALQETMLQTMSRFFRAAQPCLAALEEWDISALARCIRA